MKPLLDIGYVTVGITTGLLVALLPVLGHFMHNFDSISYLLTTYNILLGIVFFVVATMAIFERRHAIPCGCAGEMTHVHNPLIQIPVAVLIAVSIFFMTSWMIGYL